MHDHIHREIAHARSADRRRVASGHIRARDIRDRPPPRLRRHVAQLAARAAARLDAEAARGVIAG